MKKTNKKAKYKLARQVVATRNRDDAKDMGKFEMRPRDPYEILGIKKDNKKQ